MNKSFSLRITRVAFALSLMVLPLAVCAANTPARDGATIVDSGSTDWSGYKMDVWPDGNADLTLQDRGRATHGPVKTFTISVSLAHRFFADLKAARDGNAAAKEFCGTYAGDATTAYVQWLGWRSPDLACAPAPNSVLTLALINDVNAILSASGVDRSRQQRPVLAPTNSPERLNAERSGPGDCSLATDRPAFYVLFTADSS
jgi:hypothetical protein